MRRQTYALLIAFAIGSLSGDAKAQRSPQETDDVTAVLTEIILDTVAAPGEAPGGGYVIVVRQSLRLCPGGTPADEPRCPSSDPGPRLSKGTAWSEVSPSLQKALVEANREPRELPAFSFPAARVVSRKEVHDIFRGKGYWKDFYKRFPGSRGLVETTLPAFDAERNQALTYVSHSCGGLCGIGCLLYLERQSQGWKIAKYLVLWIS